MKLLYLDCFAGLCEERLLGALIALGTDEAAIRTAIAPAQLAVTPATRGGMDGVRAEVTVPKDSPELPAALPAQVQRDTRTMLAILSAAQETVSEQPFCPTAQTAYTVSAIAMALRLLGADEITASPLRTGLSPDPVTTEIARIYRIPLRTDDTPCRLISPAGAAIAAHYAVRFGTMPDMSITAIGYGAGADELPVPNLVRAVTGEQGNTMFDDILEEFCTEEIATV